MKRITIEVPEPSDENHKRCGFDVVLEDGRRCNGLAWDEMLGQVVSLTHPKLPGEPHYPMKTPEQWAERRAQLCARAEERQVHTIRSSDQGPPIAPFGEGA